MSFDMSGLPSIRRAPYSQDEIDLVNWYQTDSPYHPYTCSWNHATATMQMTKDGLVCPSCKLVQNWVLDSTFKLKDGPAYNREKEQ